MHAELEALLTLQADDATIYELEGRLDTLAPRLVDLDRARQAAVDSLARARAAVDAEDVRRQQLQARVNEHQQLHQRNLAQLDQIKRIRDATAAVAQVEQARRILADEESELAGTNRRLQELRESVAAQESALVTLEREQGAERTRLSEERVAVERDLSEARRKREGAARRVARPLLSKYDRIRGKRRSTAVFPLRGRSCGHCDTAIPLQRRSAMARGSSIEVCEVCGVLLYAPE